MKSPLGRALVLLALAAVVALFAALRLPLCPTANLFGIPCPGCGLTRATLAMLRGDLAAAFRFHPLVFVLAPLVAVFTLNSAYAYIRGPRPTARPALVTSRVTTWLAALLLIAMLGVWAARFAGHFGGPVPVRRLHQELLR